MTTEKVELQETPIPETTKTRAAAKAKSEELAISVKNSSHLGALPNNRPIEASHLNVVKTYNSVGTTRPVVASEVEMSGTLTISGNRPIAVSHLKISDTYSVMGSRPVASNEIDDPALLMGYLD
jgi:hypothetical protein